LDEFHYNDAEKYLDRAILLEPTRPDILYLKSITLYLQRRNNEAKEALKELLSAGIRDSYVTDLLEKLEE
jgi:tetratricopeptide (TPR) repeat protein